MNNGERKSAIKAWKEMTDGEYSERQQDEWEERVKVLKTAVARRRAEKLAQKSIAKQESEQLKGRR
jgi:hypothetical protein